MSASDEQRTTELSNQEREQLAKSLAARSPKAINVGYSLFDAAEVSSECVVASFDDPSLGEVSVCGAKNVLVEQTRRFDLPDGETQLIRCASVAVLEMTDSPIHVHQSTLEHYMVLSGVGQFVLGQGQQERVVEVQPGSVVLIPPGQPHGIVSSDPTVPIKALLTFTPGLASKDQPNFRDEEIIHLRTSERLRQLR